VARGLDAAATPSLLEAVMVGLDPAVELEERAASGSHGTAARVRARRSRGAETAGPARGPVDALRRHWPEYLIEAAGLGLFMISAGLFATLLWYPASPVAEAVPTAACVER